MEPIEYTLTEEDVVRWNLFCAARSSYHRRNLRIRRLLIAGLLLALALQILISRGPIPALPPFILAAVWFAIAPGLYRYQIRRHVKKLAGETSQHLLQEPTVVAPEEDGIYSRGRIGESLYKYSAIEDIVEDVGHTYVFFGKESALILPHDRIGKETVDAFVAEVERRREVPAGAETPDDAPSAGGGAGSRADAMAERVVREADSIPPDQPIG